MIAAATEPTPVVIGRRAFLPIYRSGTRCPSCDGGAWTIGRSYAECVCGTALPLAPANFSEGEH